MNIYEWLKRNGWRRTFSNGDASFYKKGNQYREYILSLQMGGVPLVIRIR